MKFWILSTILLFTASFTTKNVYLNNQKMDIKFAYTILYVENVPKTMEFYKTVLGFEQKILTPENDYGELRSGATTIAFANHELGHSNFKEGFAESNIANKPFGIELAFTTDKVEETMERAIQNGAVLLADAVTKPWGQKVGYLKDLNGFILEICTPIKSD